MKPIKKESHGYEVKKWQELLINLGYNPGKPDGIFGTQTEIATISFQENNNLIADGIVGQNTFSAAYDLAISNNIFRNNKPEDFPPPPLFYTLTALERETLFGKFEYTVNADNSINIGGDWEKENIIKVTIPQLKGVLYPYTDTPISGNVYFHKKIAKQITGFFNELESTNLHHDIITWGGSFVPRLIRGSSSLSSHSFGIAFDINMEWNKLGATPATAGERGSVRNIVAIANKYGLFWGGHFVTRKDGMHFEVAKVM